MYLNNMQKGYLGELIAREYVLGLGYQILGGNWRCRYGEIDLICRDETQRTLVFIEVKFRSSRQYGGAKQAITAVKRKRLRSLVGCWWQENRGILLAPWQSLRLDAILIDWQAGQKTPVVHHVKGI